MDKEPIQGRTIMAVRPMTDDELAREGWERAPDHQRPPVLVLDDGQTIFPSRDPEGNGPGAFFGYYPETDQGFIIGTE